MANNGESVIELNVGGKVYSTTTSTLTAKYPSSRLAKSVLACLSKKTNRDLITILRDSENRMFIDRDGESFRYILDFLRRPKPDSEWTQKLLPSVSDRYRLSLEAEFFGLAELSAELNQNQNGDLSPVTLRNNTTLAREAKFHRTTTRRNNSVENDRQSRRGPLSHGGPYFLSIGYRGAYTATRDGPTSDMAKFRKIMRITVSGRSDVAKEVFAEDLNESRDPDRYPADGYTSRYYLKHNYLELAFETLAKRGFELVASCSSGAKTLPSVAKEEFKQWTTYLEYVFCYRGQDE